MEANYNAVRKEITERLTRSWNFTDQQLSDLSLFHLLNLLMLVAGPYGYIGQFAATIFALREVLGEEQVFDKPSELRAKKIKPSELEAEAQGAALWVTRPRLSVFPTARCSCKD
jgi:hypothetical protein